MDKMSIRVRKEVVQCLKCKELKVFIYLPDFAYGERLVFSNKGMPCAFIKLVDDQTYIEYEKLVRQILQDNLVETSEDKILRLVIETFGVTCDEIDNCKVDFAQNQKKCYFCGSTNFDKKLIEPESVITIELPLVSHKKWGSVEFKKKYELAKSELTRNNVFN